jgi:hypothetical protein
MAATLMLTGCDRDAWVPESSFSDAVKEAYKECSASEIRFLSAKHGIQTAFANCGSNNFVHFTWSPDGIRIYFQLPLAGHIMNGEDKTIRALPTEQPIDNGTWLASDLLVLPLGPAADSEAFRIVLYNLPQESLETVELAVKNPRHLQAVGKRDQVLLVSGGPEETASFHQVNFTTGEVVPAFPWWSGTLSTFTYNAEHDAALIGADGKVTWYKGATGEVVRIFEDAQRASLHSDGRLIGLETMGDPISPFDQRAWGELSPEARERELKRQKVWLARQPDWVPKEITPPAIDIVDLEVNQRWRITAFYGNRFQWYEGSPDPMRHASFVMWGIEGKELNKNVALTDLSERLRYAAAGNLPMGMVLYEPPAKAGTVSLETPPTATD